MEFTAFTLWVLGSRVWVVAGGEGVVHPFSDLGVVLEARALGPPFRGTSS